MSAQLINYEDRLRQAVRFFWKGRQDAAKKKIAAGKLDQGNRGAVTGGKNLDAFRDMIIDLVHHHGPKGCEVHRGKTMVVLPGFFRPTKQWDLLIVHDNRLLAAFELKSLCGPSFGNNANNRCEEAIGSGYDFRKAQSEGLFGPGAAPFLGYMLLVEDDIRSQKSVKADSPHFPTDKIFHSSSYQQRMRILCERLVEQQLYTCASLLVAPNSTKSGDSSDLSKLTAFRFLLSRFAGHLASESDLVAGNDSRLREQPALYESGSLLSGKFFTSIEKNE